MKALLDKKIFTYNDVNSLPDGNYEIIDEEMVSMTPAGFRHGNLEGVFYALLTKHLGSKGYTAVGEVGIVIRKKPFRLRAADVVYISKKTSPQKPVGMLEVPPDLVVEIISEDETAGKIDEKVQDYLSIGVKRVVCINPFTETVAVHYHGRSDIGYYDFDEKFELVDKVFIKLRELC
ncbi:MAG: Uma2 family endonuclease [Planctomycetes bacterium]|nr:Uma2 family endonuclease [Planctomycetota bacterium]